MKNSSSNSLYQDLANELNLGQLSSIKVIQTLWGGYGELVRLGFKDISIIVKHVTLPKPNNHPRGWNTDLSHQRKLHSYQVEVNWYQNFSSKIDKRYRIPRGLKCFQTQNEWLIVMEDLAYVGFESIVNEAKSRHLKASITWLANFHASYMNRKSKLIWEIGTYWHLDTRPDELKILEDKELKYFSKQIDGELKNAKYQTIVHGDAKLANFCFNKEGTKCAAVDFQYVGHGCGMKDLILFMSSAIKPEFCFKMETWVLDTYFEELDKALKYYHPKLNSEEIKKEWRNLFCVAWADFQRFIKAWSPNHYKINDYSNALTKQALDYLKSK